MDFLLENGLVYQAGKLQKMDLLVQNGVITAFGQNLGQLFEDTKRIDVSNKLVSPGLVDVHVHYREPGFTHKETIKTGSQAAAHGGFTTVCAMPNLNPVPDTAERLANVITKNESDGVVHIKQYAAITAGLKSEQINDLAALKEAGAFAFSNDGSGIQTAGVMYQAMKLAANLDMPLVEHIEDNSLLYGGVMNEGRRAHELGLPGMLGLSESSQLARDLILAQKTGVHYHACHLSTKESVELMRLAKSKGVNVTCEVAPHHLLLSDEDIPADDAYFKMNPPLRDENDKAALLAGLLDGTIDMIATDHAPHSHEEKIGGMCQASFGITGSETAFTLLYTHFVKSGKLTLEKLLDKMSSEPAKAFRMKSAGELLIGRPADIAVFDLDTEYELKEEEYFSKGTNTPFTGEKVYGKTIMTFVAGELVYQKED
ncbi:dihydroorotase [Liquorilactobacillus mali]|uniref:Dihydroorotase n=1 Tax=Liquorilactobacillus mali KCTC 3596 = DSM 20444 TaxID=1046596 RepID=J0UU05_9LACO|nr:dihydroorotase [Liquorilactobacillus mali]EJF01015.1 dihydroorotase [Liquorilactobacillus mali KCTC 3596 = DSM 20444]KRN09199.1 dihydroorotase [Liquorilactobacillus mali KCTC 3596 = DSM 20444]MDC7952271.1 dihydroorotase [Liquorilactobacillus mali]QFQ74374.1 dihydroorotase [Liquorilactobacillus mali]